MGKILIVEDDASLREFLWIFLKKEGHDVQSAKSGVEAVKIIRETNFDVVITDLKMAKVTGLDVLKNVKEISYSTEVIIITAYSTVETAIEAMKKGAFDYIEKPFRIDEIRVIIQRCLEKRELFLENLRLKKEIKEGFRFENIAGKSLKLREIFNMIERIADTKTSILLTGESGTGKELIARAIHFNSERKSNNFVIVNCGAIPENLLESELFGHSKGSFTGAYANKKGLFEFADRGTVFLDEISELMLQMQVKLLRVLQEKRIKPVGDVNEIPVDVRIIAATNRDLEEQVKCGKFREDLYYRLNVIKINVPPLRERKEDIPLLIHFFIEKISAEMGKKIKGVSEDVVEAFYKYDFPGNIRELENIIERAIALSTSEIITREFLPPFLREERTESISSIVTIKDMEIPAYGFDLEKTVEKMERHLILKALEQTHGKKTEAAALLGISFRSIRYKLKKLGLEDAE
jgi:two-component system response regulator PilR (NtrC family)